MNINLRYSGKSYLNLNVIFFPYLQFKLCKYEIEIYSKFTANPQAYLDPKSTIFQPKCDFFQSQNCDNF